VRVLDSFATGRHSNLAPCRDGVDLIEGDVRDPMAVDSAVRGCEVVFHHAALNSVARSFENPRATLSTNADGTREVLRACRQAGVGRLVYASSSSVYGANPESQRGESSGVLPQSPYAYSKLAGELHCDSAQGELETVILRYFNVYGPRQIRRSRYAAVIPRFLQAAADGAHAVVFGSGRQSRDFTFVDDVVQANLLALDSPLDGGRRLNVGTGRATTINALVAAIRAVTGVELEARHQSPRASEPARSVADISAARRVLGYAPTVELAQGLRRTLTQDPAPAVAAA
jgi:UDP-glucose 4-epimerase